MVTYVEGLKQVNGLWFPGKDEECHPVLGDELKKLRLLPLHNDLIAVQAGGNVGGFPIGLSQMFHRVITFEPDPWNFKCLVKNLELYDNIDYYQAALGAQEGKCHITDEFTHVNCGALKVAPGGDIPVMTIDGLLLPDCDLIYLDVEGYEDLALMGGGATIANYRPVIVCENKGLNDRFPGDLDGSEEFRDWLCREFHYKFHSRLMRDDVFVCCK